MRFDINTRLISSAPAAPGPGAIGCCARTFTKTHSRRTAVNGSDFSRTLVIGPATVLRWRARYTRIAECRQIIILIPLCSGACVYVRLNAGETDDDCPFETTVPTTGAIRVYRVLSHCSTGQINQAKTNVRRRPARTAKCEKRTGVYMHRCKSEKCRIFVFVRLSGARKTSSLAPIQNDCAAIFI